MTTGRLDSRVSGPAMDPLQKEADYDPFTAAIESSYVSAFNDYVRKQLKFGDGRAYHPQAEGANEHWSFEHHGLKPANAGPAGSTSWWNFAVAMKYNPNLKVLLNAGYFDLATPFFQGNYQEMGHLPTPRPRSNRTSSSSALRVGAHGVRGRGPAPRAARQRRGLHPANVQIAEEVGSRASLRTTSFRGRSASSLEAKPQPQLHQLRREQNLDSTQDVARRCPCRRRARPSSAPRAPASRWKRWRARATRPSAS